MKTNTILVAALMMMGVAVANAQSLAVAKQAGTSVFKITCQNENMGRVKLNVVNAEGDVVFTETQKDVKAFVRPLNFKGMEQGEYTVELISAKGMEEATIRYFIEPSVKNVHLAKMGDESRYLLSVTGSDEINVRIFDGSNELVFDENKKVEQGFAQVYNLKNFSGTFTFEVSDRSGNTKTIRY